MGNILFGILLGVILTYIARIISIYFKKLQVIIKDNRENRKYYYGLSKSKRLILDEVINTYKSLTNEIEVIKDADEKTKNYHISNLDIMITLTNRTMQTASTIGGDGGISYVRYKTGIRYYKLDDK